MLTQFSYISAWSIYLGCGLFLYLILWPLYKRLGPRPVQLFFRALVAVVIFTPAISVPEQGLWAPAYIVALFSVMQHEEVMALNAAMFMAGAFCILGLMFALTYIAKRLMGSGHGSAPKSSS